MARVLTFHFDVSGLTDEEVDGLVGEVVCQAESSERHPDLPAPIVADGSRTEYRTGDRVRALRRDGTIAEGAVFGNLRTLTVGFLGEGNAEYVAYDRVELVPDQCVLCGREIEPATRYRTAGGQPRHMLCGEPS